MNAFIRKLHLNSLRAMKFASKTKIILRKALTAIGKALNGRVEASPRVIILKALGA